LRIGFFGDSLTEGRPGVSFLEELRPLLPEQELLNYGRRGDTVHSLCRRIDRVQTETALDVAVLWIGTNDLLAKAFPGHAFLKRWMSQPATRDLSEFQLFYRQTIERLLTSARHVLAVSPLLIGEDLSNPWNRELRAWSEAMQSTVKPMRAVGFLDLRSLAAERLATGKSSDYVPQRVTSIGVDTLFVRTPRAVDRVSSRRGLRLTLDGLHLNSAGAQMIAEAFRRAITEVTSN